MKISLGQYDFDVLSYSMKRFTLKLA